MDIIVGVYCVFVIVATLNLWLMPRPKTDAKPTFEVMIPARDEAHQIGPLVAGLVAQGLKVTVFDDESTDGTGLVAAEAGASVITPSEPLPAGWKGKPRACNELAKHAVADWVMFLDADTFPSPDFATKIAGLLEDQPTDVGAVTGIPTMRTGAGLEPIYLGWVPWILTATNQYGLTYALGRGHTRFTNGQIVVWRRSVLEDVQPFFVNRGEILEDVKNGRLLASKGIRIAVANLNSILAVKMYANFREAWKGMCKNSADMTPYPVTSILLALVVLYFGVGWVFASYPWPTLGLLCLSKLISDRLIRYPLWTVPFMPVTICLAAATILWSTWLRSQGKREWKGRVYVD